MSQLLAGTTMEGSNQFSKQVNTLPLGMCMNPDCHESKLVFWPALSGTNQPPEGLHMCMYRIYSKFMLLWIKWSLGACDWLESSCGLPPCPPRPLGTKTCRRWGRATLNLLHLLRSGSRVPPPLEQMQGSKKLYNWRVSSGQHTRPWSAHAQPGNHNHQISTDAAESALPVWHQRRDGAPVVWLRQLGGTVTSSSSALPPTQHGGHPVPF